MLAELESCDALCLGPVDHATYPRYDDGRRQNPSGEIRKHFDLFANVRPARTVPGAPGLVGTMDLVVVRENTQGFYSDRNMFRGYGELMPSEDVALSVGVFTREGVERVVRYAFELAAQRRRQLTVVHKANVLPETTGMFLREAERLQSSFPGVRVTDHHVDAMAALVVKDPAAFDVVVTENLFGDILSDLTAQLSGSLGLAGSLNVGTSFAVAQAAHGSAPDIAGRGVANPCSMILSIAMLLGWLGRRHGDPELARCEQLILSAVEGALERTRTRDLGGTATTDDLARAVCARLTGE